MKFTVAVLLALVLLTIESVVVQRLGMAVTRIDVTVAIVAFLALRATLMEGAFAAFSVGYLLDMMSGRPTGLYTFLAVLVFLIGRMGTSVVDVRSPVAFALFAMGADAGHGVLAAFFTWMTSKGGTLAEVASLSSLLLGVVLTGVAALVLHPLFRKLDAGQDRPQLGLLR
jgi:hypothetical protein